MERVVGSVGLGGFETLHDFQQLLLVLLSPHQDRIKQVEDVITQHGP